MIVLDSSALLAFMLREPGHERVREVLKQCCMSTVNLSEVLGRLARVGVPIDWSLPLLRRTPVQWVAFNREQAVVAADLLPRTRAFGLSLGDRACLALALSRTLTAMTADKVWVEVGLGIDIELIR